MAETGQARNVSNFSTLISFCIGYGGDYKPTNALIEIPAMQALLAQAALADVQAKLVPWKNKVADRENIYEGVRPFTTKLLAAFDACGAADNKANNVRTFHRQVHGARAECELSTSVLEISSSTIAICMSGRDISLAVQYI